MTKDTLTKLRELRRLLDWEAETASASFNMIGSIPHLDDEDEYPTREEMSESSDNLPLPRRGSEVDAFVKETTRLFRQSWVLPLLGELIEKGERKWGAK